MNTTPQVVILSAELNNLSFESNRQRTENLAGIIDDLGLNATRSIGSYKGLEEQSFVVVLRENNDLEVLKDIAFKNFKQGSILLKDSNGLAVLINSDNSTIELGKLVQVTEAEALKSENFTSVNGIYYTTKK